MRTSSPAAEPQEAPGGASAFFTQTLPKGFNAALRALTAGASGSTPGETDTPPASDAAFLAEAVTALQANVAALREDIAALHDTLHTLATKQDLKNTLRQARLPGMRKALDKSLDDRFQDVKDTICREVYQAVEASTEALHNDIAALKDAGSYPDATKGID